MEIFIFIYAQILVNKCDAAIAQVKIPISNSKFLC